MALTFTTTKLECHSWRVTKSGTGTITSVELYRYDNVLLDDELEFDANSFLAIDLSQYEDGDDGAYFVRIFYDDSGTVEAYVCIYDLCEAQLCYKNLFRYIMCKCVDPCDDGCIKRYSIDKLRTELNVMFGLMLTVENMIFYDKATTYGSYDLPLYRAERIATVGRQIDKLKEVTARCGSCDDSDVLDVTC